jgi:hypothetical protein
MKLHLTQVIEKKRKKNIQNKEMHAAFQHLIRKFILPTANQDHHDRQHHYRRKVHRQLLKATRQICCVLAYYSPSDGSHCAIRWSCGWCIHSYGDMLPARVPSFIRC